MYKISFKNYFLIGIAIAFCQMTFGQCPGTGCTWNITGPASGTYTVNVGQTLCLNPGADFSGTVSMKGGTLINCSAIAQTFSLNFSVGSQSLVYNYGDISRNGTISAVDADIYNYGSITVNGANNFHVNGDSKLYNYGTVTSTNNIKAADVAYIYNEGTLNCSNQFHMNGTSTMDNYGIINSVSFKNSHDMYNAGTLNLTGSYSGTGTGTTTFDGGCITTPTWSNQKPLVGSSCGTIFISGYSENQSSVTGNIAIVDATPPGSPPYVDSNTGSFGAGVQWTSCGCPVITCTVTNTNNSGSGSLREAINCANASSFGANIEFEIPTSDGGYNSTRGVYTINLTSLLPQITSANVTIDGNTQSVFTSNSNTTLLGTGWNVGTDNLPNPQVDGPEIEIVDNNNLVRGLDIMANNFTLSGVAIFGFGDNSVGFRIGNIIAGDWGAGLSNFLIEDCAIGIEADNFTIPSPPNQGANIVFMDCSDVTIQDNVIGHGFQSGIVIADANCTNWLIQRNEISGNGSGSAYFDGIDIKNDPTNITIKQNLINSNGALGIDCWSCLSDVTIENNRITTNGISASATEQGGIRFTGSNHVILKNEIDSNDGAGIILVPQDGGVNNSPSSNVLISQNKFYSNVSNAIDIVDTGNSFNLGDGITPNSAAPAACGYDATSGNNGIDAPVIDSLTYNSGTGVTTVYGKACPNATVEFYRSYNNAGDELNGSYYGEGIEYKGSTSTNGSGIFTTTLTGLNTSHSITALVYDASNNTSEFGRTVSLDCMRDPLVWLKADVGFTAGVWSDQSSHGNDGINSGDPTLVANSLNFNAGINYDGDDKTTITLPELAFDNGYNHAMIFMVYEPSTASTNIGILGNNSPTGVCNYFIGNNYRGRGNGCTSMPPAYGAYPHLMTFEADEENLVTGANSRLYYSGTSVSQYLFNETSAAGVNNEFHVGSSGTGSEGWFFQGDIHEFIVYFADNGAVAISESQRKKVESYLAIKYGITIGNDYTDSQ